MQMQALMLTLGTKESATFMHCVNGNNHRHFDRMGSRLILPVKPRRPLTQC